MISTTAPPIDQVLARLQGVKGRAPQFSAKCPAHDDRNASLSVRAGDDGKVALHCHAGCAAEDVVAAVGLAVGDLFPKDATTAKHLGDKRATRNGRATPRKIVATYSYRNAAGELVMQAVRYDPKGFMQRKPKPGGGWDWQTADLQPWPLYRLPELNSAGEDSLVFVVEGEKDADRLAAEGLVATSTCSGAGKSSKSDLTPLHGRHVVLIPDNDDAGRNHVDDLGSHLVHKAAGLRLLVLPGLPDKGDVSDWLDAGHDGEELLRLAEAAPAWTATPAASKAKPEQRRRFIMRRGDTIDDGGTEFLWRRRLAMGCINVIFSRPGEGKSTIAADLGAHVTQGNAWPDGQPCRKGSVLYLKGEGSDAAIRDRMSSAGADPTKYVVIGRADDPDDDAMIDLATDAGLVAEALDEIPDVVLVVIDTLDSTFPSMKSIDNANIRRCLFPLQELAEQRKFCVVVLAHTNKGGYADPLDRLSGGRAIGGAARSVWYLGKRDPDDEASVFAPVKCNDFCPAKPIEYQIVGGSVDRPGAVRWGDETDVKARDLDQPRQAEKADKTADCTAWLSDLLAGGPLPTAEVARLADQAQYGGYVMKRARQALGVKTTAAKGSVPPDYYVCLPGQVPPSPTPNPGGPM